MFKFLQDITNLYSSRDALWKELSNLQQTSKRRDKYYRQKIHNLERRVHDLEVGPRYDTSDVGNRVGNTGFTEHKGDQKVS